MNNIFVIVSIIIVLALVRTFKRKEGDYIIQYKENSNIEYLIVEWYQIRIHKIEYKDNTGKLSEIPIGNIMRIKKRM